MDEREWLTDRFEQHRSHLRAVAYRMLGSVTEADDALQEARLRIRDQDPTSVENMQAWLTTIVGRVSLNMLRSRASRHEELPGHVPDPDLARQRQVVDAFFAASRDGDFDALVAMLDPDVELRIDGGELRQEASLVLRGAAAVTGHTATYSKLYPFVRPALVNGTAGAVVAPHGRPFSVMAFTVTNGRITQIDALIDPERLARLDLSIL